jgi:ABC-type glycerol-3-phosphate transport system substrate-binding protein
MKLLYLVLAVLLAILPACGGVPPAGSPTAAQTPATEPSSPTEAASLPPVPASPTPGGPVSLRVWLPPQFDPAADTPAGKILQARLDDFRKRRPGVELDVRVKSVYGSGGLLDSLSAASAAAPKAAPDLIALPRDLLEAAALKGLLRPYDHLNQAPDDPDWYGYAQELSKIQESVYGLPFAGDALALVYRPEAIAQPPQDWSVTSEISPTLVYPAADPQALFTLTLYQSNDGPVRDDQGRPMIDAVPLTEVLTFYQGAQAAGMMPELLTQYQSDDQVWDAFRDHQTDMAATWVSRFLGEASEDRSVASLPTVDGEPYTLATGWVWALPAHQSSGQQAANELAEYLTEPEFLADWTEAAGVLPVRPSSLAFWDQAGLRQVIGEIAGSAHALPPADILIGLGDPLWQATVDVLSGQTDPATAALSASARLTGP